MHDHQWGRRPQPIDCSKLQLCTSGSACTCTAAGCVSQTLPPSTLAASYPGVVDDTFDDTTMTGTLMLVAGNCLTVHLTKTTTH